METLVLFTPETQKAVKAFLNDPEKQALLQTPEAKQAFAEGCSRVKRMAANRRASNAVNPHLYFERC